MMRASLISALLGALILMPTGCGDPEDQAAILYRAATEAIESREPLDAEHLLMRIERGYRETLVAPRARDALAELRAGQEASALDHVRTISRAQSRFAEANAGRYAFSLQELVVAGLVDPETAEVTVQGYRFRTTTDPETGYFIEATPIVSPGSKRHFRTDKSQTIRWAMGTPARAGDPAVE